MYITADSPSERTDAVVELFGLVPSLRYRLLAREGRRPRPSTAPPPPPPPPSSSSGGSSRVVPRSNAAKKVERGARGDVAEDLFGQADLSGFKVHTFPYRDIKKGVREFLVWSS